MTDLKGKTLFITGATRGIGYAIAERAAKDGANIAIIAKTTEPHPMLPGTIYDTRDEILEMGQKAIAIKTNLREELEIQKMVEKTIAEFGRIDILINNAGALWWKKDSGEGRTHLLRAEQVIESKTDTVVTGCNFCYGMMNQGIGPLTPAGQEEIKVKDVADIVAENLS